VLRLRKDRLGERKTTKQVRDLIPPRAQAERMTRTSTSETRPAGAARRARVSIVMPTHNRAHLVGESIESALGQSLPPAEIIVVDDGSSDETPAILRSFGDRLIGLRQDKAGKSAALNRGIAAASGDFLLVLDDDDLLPPYALAAHVAALEAMPEAGFSYGRFARFTGQGEDAPCSTDREELPPEGEKRLLVQLMQCCFLPNPTWMVRRKLQLAAGRYRSDLPRGQDYEMILRLARAAPGARAEGIVLYQRKHVAARTTSHGTVVAKDTVAGWIDAERTIFAEIDESWSDADFQPFETPTSGAEAERLAVLQRAVILFMRKLHDRAEGHLARYCALLGNAAPGRRELAVATDLLGARYGIGEILDASHDPARLAALDLPLALRRSMARHLPWRMRELIGGGRFGDAARLLGWGQRALGTAAVLGAAGGRLEDHARRGRTRSRISAS
jgi:glycosyltransferase involved in cell wall biosynthesis